jgi:negative regulator of sigma-B (phosphoserine phosphatase)
VIAVEHLIVPREGEALSGDAVFVRREGDRTLVSVIDVLGHGPEAAEVAATAVEKLREARLDRGVTMLLECLHEGLRGTRGATALLCLVTGGVLQGTSVGNITLCAHGGLPIVPTPGVVGGQMRPLRVFVGKLSPGDRLVAHTDGIRAGVLLGDLVGISGRDACAEVMRARRRPNDDAAVLVLDATGIEDEDTSPEDDDDVSDQPPTVLLNDLNDLNEHRHLNERVSVRELLQQLARERS